MSRLLTIAVLVALSGCTSPNSNFHSLEDREAKWKRGRSSGSDFFLMDVAWQWKVVNYVRALPFGTDINQVIAILGSPDGDSLSYKGTFDPPRSRDFIYYFRQRSEGHDNTGYDQFVVLEFDDETGKYFGHYWSHNIRVAVERLK